MMRLRALCAAITLALCLGLLLHGEQAFAQAAQLPPGKVCFQATTGVSGVIGALGTPTGGSGGTSGTYANVALTGGSGSGATANFTVSGGAVTSVTVVNPGVAYVVSDTLSASSASIGNVSGFSVQVLSTSINSSLAGGTVGFYVPSTLTPSQTWQDSGEVTPNANPVPLDSNGCALIYGSGNYRQIVKDSLGNTIWDQLTSSSNLGLSGTGIVIVTNGVVSVSSTLPSGTSIPSVNVTGITFAQIGSYNAAGNSFITCGRTKCGDGGGALMVPATSGNWIPRFNIGSSGTGCASAQPCVTDGATTSSSYSITTNSATFQTWDVGRPISDSVSGACIPANDTIASVQSATAATLTTPATCTVTPSGTPAVGDTFVFGTAAVNSPGYMLDSTSTAYQFGQQVLVPAMFGASPLPNGTGTSPDSLSSMQAFFDACTLTGWKCTNFQTNNVYYLSGTLNIFVNHLNPFFFDCPTRCLQFSVASGAQALAYYFPGGVASSGGAGSQNRPAHTSFNDTLKGLYFNGSYAGQLCQIGDPSYGDNTNNLSIDIACNNNLYQPSLTLTAQPGACAFEGIFNSKSVGAQCQVARRSTSSASDGALTSNDILASATLSFVAGDVGSYLAVYDASNHEDCPAGSYIQSVSTGSATIYNNGAPASCTNGTSYRIQMAQGWPLTSTANNTVAFSGITNHGIASIHFVDVSSFGNKNLTFNDIDFDVTPLFLVWDDGANDYGNVITSGNSAPTTYGVCQTVASNNATGNKFYGTFFGSTLNVLGQTGVCSNSITGWYVDAPGADLHANTPQRTSWFPAVPITATTYTNATGQAAQVALAGATTTASGVSINGGGAIFASVTGLNTTITVPSGQTLEIFCSPCGTAKVLPLW